MSDSRRQNSGSNGEGIRRRDFLALGTAAAAATAAAALPRAGFADASPLGVDMGLGGAISVGYFAGSDEWVRGLDLPWEAYGVDYNEVELDIQPAESLQVGSQLAGADIELVVHGFFPRLPRAGQASWKSAYLFASVPTPPEMIFGPNPLPFLAWSARMDPQPHQAAKVRPVLSTGVDGSLQLALELRSPAAASGLSSGSMRRTPAPSPVVRTRSTNFTVDDIAGRPKLQEGVYLLAFEKTLWNAAWRGTLQELCDVDGLDSVAIGIRRLE
jgi:hypothetical protein